MKASSNLILITIGKYYLISILQEKTLGFREVLRHRIEGNSLVVQWLGLSTFTAGARGLIPCRGTKIPQAAQRRHRIEI